MTKIKTSLSLVGNYMCKNPPIVVFNVTEHNNEKQTLKKYLFNTPSDTQRNLQSQFVTINGSETIMFTTFSHQVLSGLVSLILSLHDRQKSKRLLKLKIYGTQKHWDYFQNAKFHLGQKVFGISYASWLIPQYHRMGLVDQGLYNEILRSDKFSNYVWRLNWRVENEPKEKINDSREYMKGRNEYYEDEYMVMRPFFENNPKSEWKKHKGSKGRNTQNDIKEYTNSSTHFLCICKHQQQQKQDEEGSKKQQGHSNAIHFQPATLIITYKSVEQISKILARSDKVQGVNKDLGLLDFIEMNLKGEGSASRIRLKSIVHIISTPSLVHSQQFHHLFTTLDNLCYPSSTPATHLFYGHGIKSSTTDIHHLLNSYYRGARFYSICSKLFKCIPNITQNHLNYWSMIFDKDFADVCAMLDERGANMNGSLMEVYKPIHNVTVYGEQSGENQTNQSDENKESFYSVSAELLAQIKYPLFSTSIQYRFPQQLKYLYKKKAAFQQYYPSSKPKASKGKLINKIKQIKQFDPKVIFLGTSSKSPNQLRNVSGILLELPHDNTETLFIMDCGAGTYEQFVYLYSPEELEKKLMSLKVIFMTHLHADHNLGIVDLIKKRNDLIKRKGLQLEDHKLFVILPFNTLSWFYGYCKVVQDVGEGCEILLTQSLTGEKINLKDDFFQSRKCGIAMQRIRLSPGKLFTAKTQSTTKQPAHQNSSYIDRYIRFGSYEEYIKSIPEEETSVLRDIINEHGYRQDVVKEMFGQLLAKMKLKKFMPSKVFHCPFSYGVVIEHNNGIKISYSGDCRPTPEFLQHAQNSTLLIHEATYESHEQDKALYKLHSTFQQAVQACMTSKSDHVCLTHFKPSAFDRDTAQTLQQSLYKPEVFDTYRKKTIIACDFLSFNLSEAEDVAKASKVISHIGRNSIIQKNANPFSVKFIYEAKKEEQNKNKIPDQQNED